MPTKKTAQPAVKVAAKKPAKKASARLAAEPKKIGLPATGRTPGKDRQSKMLSELREAGGDKVAVYLKPESIQDMQTIIAVKKFAARKGRTQAIAYSLAVTAQKLRRKESE